MKMPWIECSMRPRYRASLSRAAASASSASRRLDCASSKRRAFSSATAAPSAKAEATRTSSLSKIRPVRSLAHRAPAHPRSGGKYEGRGRVGPHVGHRVTCFSERHEITVRRIQTKQPYHPYLEKRQD